MQTRNVLKYASTILLLVCVKAGISASVGSIADILAHTNPYRKSTIGKASIREPHEHVSKIGALIVSGSTRGWKGSNPFEIFAGYEGSYRYYTSQKQLSHLHIDNAQHSMASII